MRHLAWKVKYPLCLDKPSTLQLSQDLLQRYSKKIRSRKKVEARVRVRAEVKVKIENIWIKAYLARKMMFLPKNQLFQNLNHQRLPRILVKNRYRSRDKVLYHARKERNKEKWKEYLVKNRKNVLKVVALDMFDILFMLIINNIHY